jgi:3-hydroxyisobutyrate dehydrogenase-like beta-hydroxyacid dehydrogenase
MKIAIIAAGEMGSGVGARLHQRGVAVMTSLAGRGAASAERARRAGMVAIDDDEALVAASDIVLSILPPAEAVALAQRLAPALARTKGRVLYVDCNAVAPATVRAISDIVGATGARFADIGIIGGPPRDGYSPHLYASGEVAGELRALRDFGLDIRLVEGGIGAASALKLSYAAMTKGLTAIAIAVARGGATGQVAAALRAEFAESQPQLLAWLQRQIPTVPPKAYRWVGEMEEIARFLGDDATAELFAGAAHVYDAVAARWAESGEAGLGFLADLYRR